MLTLRVLGAAMVLYGGVMLLLLFTPYKDWALDHSIAEVVSYSDKRVDNQVSGSVDEPIAIAGSAVLVFAGLWIGLLVPHQLGKFRAGGFDEAGDAAGEGPTGPPPPSGPHDAPAPQ